LIAVEVGAALGVLFDGTVVVAGVERERATVVPTAATTTTAAPIPTINLRRFFLRVLGDVVMGGWT
jgi:hypothetical protein